MNGPWGPAMESMYDYRRPYLMRGISVHYPRWVLWGLWAHLWLGFANTILEVAL